MQTNDPEKLDQPLDENQDRKWYQNAWLQRIGIFGFMFFLIKGLIWLAVFFGFFKWLG